MTLSPCEVLILTGTPGSGKTTAANTLAHLPGCPKVHLHSDDFWRFIKTGAIAPWHPQAQAQNATVIAVLAGATASYAQGGYFVLVDGIIGPWFLDAFRGLGLPIHYIVLRPDLDQAIARCQTRGADTLGDPGTITALHQQFGQLGPFERHWMDVSRNTPDETCAALLAAIQDRRFLLK